MLVCGTPCAYAVHAVDVGAGGSATSWCGGGGGGVHDSWQGSKAPEPWHFCGASSGAGGKSAGSAGAGAVSPEDVDYCYLIWFNTP